MHGMVSASFYWSKQGLWLNPVPGDQKGALPLEKRSCQGMLQSGVTSERSGELVTFTNYSYSGAFHHLVLASVTALQILIEATSG